ncbi:MAG: MerR family transcriptional regulator [Actinomycetota bacterium]|nr:MerR family transcriptional regulator [Actinomycetota bacterium]
MRTLRHYDEIGLLVPSMRSSAGHRRYRSLDVRRLHLILALRGLGLALIDIGDVLDRPDDLDLAGIIRRQLRQVEQCLAVQKRLRRVLDGLLATLAAAAEPTPAELLNLIKEMTTMADRLTPEELRELTEGRQRMIERLSSEQVAELAAQRRSRMAQLSEDEFAALTRRRSAMTSDRGDGPTAAAR